MNKAENRPVHPLRELRKKHKLTQSDLGGLLGCKGMYIAQIENGYQHLNGERVQAVADLFDLSLDQVQQYLAQYDAAREEYLRQRLQKQAA